MKRDRRPGRNSRVLAPEIAEIGVRIRQLRKKRELTQDDLADGAELTPNYIGTIEHGKRDPSLTTIDALAMGLGIPVAEIFGPTQPLSENAIGMAQLFSKVSPKMQRALLELLHGVATKP